MSRKAPGRGGPVGYGRPPQHSRYKPGQSGNLRGRPRNRAHAPDLETALRDILKSRVKITQDGRTKSVPFLDAFLAQLCSKALRGDPKAIALLIRLIECLPPTTTEPDTDPIDYGAQVRSKLEEMAKNMAALDPKDPKTPPPVPDVLHPKDENK